MFSSGTGNGPVTPTAGAKSDRALSAGVYYGPDDAFFKIGFFRPRPDYSNAYSTSSAPGPFSFRRARNRPPTIDARGAHAHAIHGVPARTLPYSNRGNPNGHPSRPRQLPYALQAAADVAAHVSANGRRGPARVLRVFPEGGDLSFSRCSLCKRTGHV